MTRKSKNKIQQERNYFVVDRFICFRNFRSHHVTEFFTNCQPSSGTFCFLVQKITAFRFLSPEKKSDFFHRKTLKIQFSENFVKIEKNLPVEVIISRGHFFFLITGFINRFTFNLHPFTISFNLKF